MDKARMVVVFRPPLDNDAFDRHYFDVHVPLAKKLPGLRRYEVSRGTIATLNAAADTYLIATLYFDDLESIHAAFASEIGQKCGADRKAMIDDVYVQTFLFESEEL
jgi:uncharacterized protein (TIGR02118 family)